MEYEGFVIKSGTEGALFSIGQKGAGPIPVLLQGLYTSSGQAKLGIDQYYESLKKGKRNDKKNSGATN